MDIINEFNYIDGITIVDTSGTILFTIKFNPEINENVNETIVGKKLWDVFTNINVKNSTLFQSMEFERPITKKNQNIVMSGNKKYKIDVLAFPIKYNGRIVGAIDLSRNTSCIKKSDRDSNENCVRGISGIKDIEFSDKARYYLDDIVYTSKVMKDLVVYAYEISESTTSVFIYGDTGTGKELFAHGIHNASDRKDKPFIVQNCSAIPETLLESILFGTSKGSFTGAINKKGLFEIADGGTLFLDEIHAMPYHLQSKLLRVTQDGYIRRVGDETIRKVDVRLIVATNISYTEIIKGDIIRKDLYYRLAVINIEIPPLAERKEDIMPLVNHFIIKFNNKFKKRITRISQKLLDFMIVYEWPGNVRELENVIEACFNVVSVEEYELDIECLPSIYRKRFRFPVKRQLKKILEESEIRLINEALFYSKGNVSVAAKALTIPRQTLQQKMIKYGMKKDNGYK